MSAAVELAVTVGIVAACAALAVARASYYRRVAPDVLPSELRPTPGRALATEERARVLGELNSARFVDLAPREVYARLLDEGRYLCSISTMYRVLADAGEVRERRDVLRHPSYARPELVATAPNEVWSWDITKLRGPRKGVYYCLYVVLDLYSRYVVGWMLAPTENGVLAGELIDEACEKQGIAPGALTLHNDRGSPMKARSLAVTLAELGVLHSFSARRSPTTTPSPRRSSRPSSTCWAFPPASPASTTPGRSSAASSPGTTTSIVTPASTCTRPPTSTSGAASVTAARQLVLDAAHAAHPERFVRKAPIAAMPPAAAWINPPLDAAVSPSQEARA